MDNQFNPSAIEQSLYESWEQNGYFKPRAAADGANAKPYCIVIPPPNVTGSLHMGHAFQHTLMDSLIRYQRMRGKRNVVADGHRPRGYRHPDAGRAAAQRRGQNTAGDSAATPSKNVWQWQWKAESGGNISRQLRRMGSSLDWSRDRFTLDDDYARSRA